MTSKLIERNELADLIRQAQGEDKVVVFTNGCFDLLHVGHVRLLQEAKELGDILIVGLNSDRSVKKLKGEGRPLVAAEERAEILSALAAVDFVTIFDEDTPETLLLELKPDWHVKGGDYKPGELPEAKTVASYGGKVKTLSHTPERSTSRLKTLLER